MKVNKKWFGIGVLTCSVILAVGCSNNKTDDKGTAASSDTSEGKLAKEQVLNLTEVAELPTGDTALSTDTCWVYRF